MYLETIKFVCEMVTKLCVFKHSPLVLKIAPTTTLTMVLYTKLGLTLSTAEGNDTAIFIFHSSLKLTVRALKVWLGS